jgi:hypothetical protein
MILIAKITACAVVQCSIMVNYAFLWEHAIFGRMPRLNPLTDRNEIFIIDYVNWVTSCTSNSNNRFNEIYDLFFP